MTRQRCRPVVLGSPSPRDAVQKSACRVMQRSRTVLPRHPSRNTSVAGDPRTSRRRRWASGARGVCPAAPQRQAWPLTGIRRGSLRCRRSRPLCKRTLGRNALRTGLFRDGALHRAGLPLSSAGWWWDPFVSCDDLGPGGKEHAGVAQDTQGWLRDRLQNYRWHSSGGGRVPGGCSRCGNGWPRVRLCRSHRWVAGGDHAVLEEWTRRPRASGGHSGSRWAARNCPVQQRSLRCGVMVGGKAGTPTG